MNAPERLHHPFSPSTLQTREASPCYHPRGGTSDAAEMGTRQHDATEHEDHDNPLLDDKQSAAVAECIALLDAAIADAGPGAAAEKEGYWPIDNEEFFQDTRRWVGTTAGYSDATVFSAVGPDGTQTIHVIDWKFGKQPVVPSSDNLQGFSYLLGVVHRQASRGIAVREARITFHCPHIDETTTHVFTAADFPAMRARVVAVVSRSRAADRAWSESPTTADRLGLVIPTTSSCLFCGRIAECPAMGRLAVTVGKKFRPLLIPPDISGDTLCAPGEATAGLALGKALEEWARAYRKKITSRSLEDDDFLPEGYGLVVTEPRKVVDNAKFFRHLVVRFGEQRVHESFIELPLGRVEEAVSDEAPRGAKEAAVKALGAELEAAGITARGTPVISLRMKGSK